MSVMSELRRRVRAERSFTRYEPCLPRPAKQPPTGPGWIHEIKHEGFRILAQRDSKRVRLLTRNGNDFSDRFPQIVEALRALPVGSCIIDGEAIVTDDKGLAVFDLIREHCGHAAAGLCAFDLIELDGEYHRRVRIEERKRALAGILGRFQHGVVLNEFFEGDVLGCEGIVSKRLGSPYKSGRSPYQKCSNEHVPKAIADKRRRSEGEKNQHNDHEQCCRRECC
jgi:bifunctional non-homologous end joining protein LigD